MNSKSVAGMSIKGGRNENFYFCLLEYFEDSKRWFLKSIHQSSEEDRKNWDKAISKWIDNYELGVLCVDFPLSLPVFLEESENNQVVFEDIELKIEELLKNDQVIYENNPKLYEKKRQEEELVQFNKNIFVKKSLEPILSKSFKRKLKKGFLPYYHRPIDFWIWCEYYDQYLKVFENVYDSFGNVSTMLFFKMQYLKKFFPEKLELYESDVNLCLLELLRKKIISIMDIKNLNDIEEGVEARHRIIREVEKKLNIFIYAHDLEIIIKDQRAFNSFIISIVSRNIGIQKTRIIPSVHQVGNGAFQLPDF